MGLQKVLEGGMNSIDHPRCALNFLCLDAICNFSGKCTIYQKVHMIAQNKRKFYNYGKKRNLQENGRLKMSDVKILYFTALREGFRCPDCGEAMILGDMKPRSASIDHIINRANGGRNNFENLRICCSDCNQKKSRSEIPIVTNNTHKHSINTSQGVSN
jgi:5-methylcytosine-specific restriction endonuclease McrA